MGSHAIQRLDENLIKERAERSASIKKTLTTMAASSDSQMLGLCMSAWVAALQNKHKLDAVKDLQRLEEMFIQNRKVVEETLIRERSKRVLVAKSLTLKAYAGEAATMQRICFGVWSGVLNQKRKSAEEEERSIFKEEFQEQLKRLEDDTHKIRDKFPVLFSGELLNSSHLHIMEKPNFDVSSSVRGSRGSSGAFPA